MIRGRGEETAAIARALRSGRAVVVVGEAGVGKTTLLRSLAPGRGRRLYEGGALATLRWHAYLPLQRALRRELHGAPPDVAREVAGEVGAGILALDDLQWADADTLAVTHVVARDVAVVATVRSGADGADAAFAALPDALRVDLYGLADDDAVALLAEQVPHLDDPSRQRLLARAGGNPLLLQELASTGAVDGTLADALAARLHDVSADARDALALLALLGRPVPAGAVGPGCDELAAAQLVTMRGDYVALRHGVLGEQALLARSDAERAALRARAAGIVRDPGEAARHYAAAGDRVAAGRAARKAAAGARRPDERARHLELAARCADLDERAELAIEAANALLDSGAPADALVVLAGIEDGAAALPRVRALVRTGDAAGAREVAEQSLPASPLADAALRCELATLLLWPFFEPDGAQREAVAARASAMLDATGERRVAAVQAVGALAGDGEWEGALVAVMTDADAADQALPAIALALGRVLDARGDQAAAVAARGGALLEHVVAFHVGGLCDALRDDASTLDGPVHAPARPVAAAHVALAHADTGHAREALDAAALARAWARSPAEAALAQWAVAECELHAGRLRRAATAAADALALAPAALPVHPLAALTAAWAAVLGGDAVPPLSPVGMPAVACELDAIALYAAEKWDAAEEAFDGAAAAWFGRQRRSALRCAWAAGDAARRAGARDRAVERLTALEREAELLGHLPLVARARASLRGAGVRRAPQPRGRKVEELTAREYEVLSLVARGQTTRQIAAALGVAMSTVDTQVEAAMHKLGARTRRQAAAMLPERARA